MKKLIYIFIALVLTGCESQYEGTVLVKTEPPYLEIFNDTDTPVFYLVYDSPEAALIDIADPCQNFQPNLPANSKLEMPFTEITGFDKDTESFWIWWTNCKGDGDSRSIEL